MNSDECIKVFINSQETCQQNPVQGSLLLETLQILFPANEGILQPNVQGHRSRQEDCSHAASAEKNSQSQSQAPTDEWKDDHSKGLTSDMQQKTKEMPVKSSQLVEHTKTNANKMKTCQKHHKITNLVSNISAQKQKP